MPGTLTPNEGGSEGPVSLHNAMGLERVPDTFRYMSALGYSLREAVDAALAECIEYGVKLLILDSLGPALEGDAEAARDVIGFFHKVLEPFRVAGVTVLVIDHQSHLRSGQRYQDKSAFGSVFKTNLARSVIQVEPTSHEDGALTVVLRQKKTQLRATRHAFRGEAKVQRRAGNAPRRRVGRRRSRRGRNP